MYYNSLVLSQHEPAHSSALKLLFFFIPALLLCIALYLYSTGETEGAWVLAGEGLVFGAILWAVLPRSYQVFEDHLKVVLGGPFAVNIPFEQIEKVEVTERNALTINFVSVVRKSYVRVVKKRGMGVAITPEHAEVFVAAATSALNQWARNSRPTPRV